MSKDRNVDHKLVRQLAEILNDTDLNEIEIEQDDLRIRVARDNTPVAVTAPLPAPIAAAPTVLAAAPAIEAPSAVPVSNGHSVTSPMVGTVYMSAEPGADPYIKVGDSVKVGQTIMIVEAMKHMNQIASDRSGIVEAILVEDGQPVEYGEALLSIV